MLGSIWNGLERPEGAAKSDWVMLRRTYVHPYPITADPAGRGQLWIILGTDSAFEETTEVYYYRTRVELQPV